MASCDHCGSFIIFGGEREGNRRFCNKTCRQNGFLAISADKLPQHVVDEAVDEMHASACPVCDGPGPVDVHMSHTIWSALYLTSWKSSPTLCCRSCGRKKQFGALCFSTALGWWGFPWGIVITPVQILRNISGLIGGPNPDVPSEKLEEIVRLDLAQRIELGEAIPGSSRLRKRSSGPVIDKIDVECETCCQKFKAKVELAGRTGSCRGCGAPITVPELDLVDEDDVWEDVSSSRNSRFDDDVFDSEFDDEQEDWDGYHTESRGRAGRGSSGRGSRRHPESKKSGSRILMIVLCVLGVLFVLPIVIFVIAFLFFADPQQIAQENRNRPAQHAPMPAPAPQMQPGLELAPNLPVASPAFPDEQVPNVPATQPGFSPLPGQLPGSERAAPDVKSTPVEPLENPDPAGRLWIVLSNLREENPGSVNPFNRPFVVNYQVANGAPDPTARYVLQMTRKLGTFQERADVPVDLTASGSVRFQPPPQFVMLNDFTVKMVRELASKKWQRLSAELKTGGDRTTAEVPKSVREIAGADAAGKMVAIANAEMSSSPPFPMLSMECELITAPEPVGYYFVVVESSGNRIEFDVTRQLKATSVGEESSLGGRLLGAGAQVSRPFKLHIEKRKSPSRSPFQRERDTPEVVSNTLSVE